jgi:hypothetical protein
MRGSVGAVRGERCRKSAAQLPFTAPEEPLTSHCAKRSSLFIKEKYTEKESIHGFDALY